MMNPLIFGQSQAKRITNQNNAGLEQNRWGPHRVRAGDLALPVETRYQCGTCDMRHRSPPLVRAILSTLNQA
jgi:hypothetical protein